MGGMAASAVVAAGGRVIGKNGNGSSSWIRIKDRKGLDRKRTNKVCCHSSPAVLDPYKTLRIHPGASESEVKKAFRQLALQYHPDVCRGSNCLVQFQEINHAYDMVMNDLQGGSQVPEMMVCNADADDEEMMRGMCDPGWEPWEEWMGWEGAGIRDYSSHINPYI